MATELLSNYRYALGNNEMNGRQKSVSSSQSAALQGPYGWLGFRRNNRRKVHSVNPRTEGRRHSAPCTARSEVNLVRQVSANDPNAHAQLFEMYAPKLYRTALAILRNKGDAEDAVPDSWLRMHNKLSSFRGGSSFSTWLIRIAINSALMICRRNRSAPRGIEGLHFCMKPSVRCACEFAASLSLNSWASLP